MNWLRKLVVRLLGIETEGVPQADYDKALARAEAAEQKAAEAQGRAADTAQRLALLQEGMRAALDDRDAAAQKLDAVANIYKNWRDGK